MNLANYFAYMDLLPAGKEMMGKMVRQALEAEFEGRITTRRHTKAAV